MHKQQSPVIKAPSEGTHIIQGDITKIHGENIITIPSDQANQLNNSTEYAILESTVQEGLAGGSVIQQGNIVLGDQDYIVQYQNDTADGQEEGYYAIAPGALDNNTLYTVITESDANNQQTVVSSAVDANNFIVENEPDSNKPVEIYIENKDTPGNDDERLQYIETLLDRDKTNHVSASSDICQVRVELTDQRFLADMDNIDLFVMYTCKKCGAGYQSVVDAIFHSRCCKNEVIENDIISRHMKIVQLFNDSSFSSSKTEELNISETRKTQENENQEETLKTVKSHKEKSELTEIKCEDVQGDQLMKTFPDDMILKVVDMCKKQWQQIKDNAANDAKDQVNLEPRKWFCSSCTSTVIFSETEYDEHFKAHSVDDNTKKFSCVYCADGENRRHKLQCDDWNTMKTHLTTVHKIDMKLKCDICQKVLPNHHKYHKHMREHKHYCAYNLCGFSSNRLETVTVHQLCHTAEKSFKCFKCNWTSESHPKKWTLMHMHLTRSHPGTIDPLYKCSMCDKEFPEIRRFNAHMTVCKKLPAPLCPTCLICGKSVLENELSDHIYKHSQSYHWYTKFVELLADENKETQEDSNDSNSLKNLKERFKPKRLLVSSGLLRYKCKFCYKKFATQLRLDKHIMHIHPKGDVKTVCETCGACFRNREQWRNHNRQVHLGIKRKHKTKNEKGTKSNKIYMCETCTYATPSISRLRNHYSTVHMGVYPYNCSQCTYKTNEQSDLKRHMLKHTGEKPYACEYCSFKTTQRWILVNHCERQHGVQMPKWSQNTLGCQWSLKRGGRHRQADLKEVNEQNEELTQEEPIAVQYILDQVCVGDQDQQQETQVIQTDALEKESEMVVHISIKTEDQMNTAENQQSTIILPK